MPHKTYQKGGLFMKKLLLLLALGLTTLSMNAQDLRNANNATIGKIESDGTVRNSSNSTVGKIERDGTIRNANNSSIGKVDNDGTVRNSSNSTIGKIDSDGTVRNSNNSSIGYAKGVPVRYAAVFFFFDFFKR